MYAESKRSNVTTESAYETQCFFPCRSCSQISVARARARALPSLSLTRVLDIFRSRACSISHLFLRSLARSHARSLARSLRLSLSRALALSLTLALSLPPQLPPPPLTICLCSFKMASQFSSTAKEMSNIIVNTANARPSSNRSEE